MTDDDASMCEFIDNFLIIIEIIINQLISNTKPNLIIWTHMVHEKWSLRRDSQLHLQIDL